MTLNLICLLSPLKHYDYRHTLPCLVHCVFKRPKSWREWNFFFFPSENMIEFLEHPHTTRVSIYHGLILMKNRFSCQDHCWYLVISCASCSVHYVVKYPGFSLLDTGSIFLNWHKQLRAKYIKQNVCIMPYI